MLHQIREFISGLIEKSMSKGRPNSDSFLDKDIFGIRTFEKKWDYVKWLNQK